MLKNLVKKLRKTKGGFTLIELIVVIAILAILAVVLIPLVSGQINKARDSSAKSDLNAAYLACQMAFTNGVQGGSSYTVGTPADQTTVLTNAGDYFKGDITGVVFEGADAAEATGIKSVTILENSTSYTYSPTDTYTTASGTQSHFEKGSAGF